MHVELSLVRLTDLERHCVDEGESEESEGSEASCAKIDREYNVPLRIGLIFAVLATSAVGESLASPAPIT